MGPRKIADLKATLVEHEPGRLSVIQHLFSVWEGGREFHVGMLINGDRLEISSGSRVFSISVTQIANAAIERIHEEMEAETALEDELQPKVG